MEKSYRRALMLAFSALILMLLTNACYPETTPVSARVLIASLEDSSVYAGVQDLPERAEMVHFSRETLLKGPLLLVNAQSPLPKDMPVQQARNVRKMVGLYVPAAQDVSLCEEAIYALCDLCAVNPLIRTWITAGMRSPSEQHALQDAAFENYRKTMTTAAALAAARRDVPDSGLNEHQLATAFDLQFTGALDWSQDDPLLRSTDGRWLRENAWQYGFIRRYPPEKAAITGIHNEALHFRYVGREHALVMQSTGWCLEEYLQALHTYGAVTVESLSGNVYILCVPMDERGADFPVLEGYSCAVSADNQGYAVCVLNQSSAAR